MNVVASWLAQFVCIAGGFVLPRVVNDKIGQGALGVWDFAWSLTGLFALLQGGIVSSVNRFVAKHRALNDIEGISSAVSSVTLILVALASVIVALALAIAPNVPGFLTQIKLVQAGPFWSGLYHYAWFIGFILAFVIYAALMRTKESTP